MMWRWNLPGLWISMRPFIWQKIWVPPLGRGRAWPKNLKKTQKLFFWLNFLEFSVLYQNRNICNSKYWPALLFQIWEESESILGSYGPKSTQKWDFLWVGKHLSIDNLATTNAMKMKLFRIVYLHKTFHFTKDMGVTFRVWQDVALKPPKKPPKICFLA